MYPPTLTALPHTPANTAAVALNLTHGTLVFAFGAVFLGIWFALHRYAAHRHPGAEHAAKVFLVAAGVVFSLSPVVAKAVANVNDFTARVLSDKTHDQSFANDHLGILSVLAFVVVAFAAAVTVDVVKHIFNKGGTGKVNHGPRWARLEESFNKWGWFGLAPLSATLPGSFGLGVLTILTMLTEWLANHIGPYIGLA